MPYLAPMTRPPAPPRRPRTPPPSRPPAPSPPPEPPDLYPLGTRVWIRMGHGALEGSTAVPMTVIGHVPPKTARSPWRYTLQGSKGGITSRQAPFVYLTPDPSRDAPVPPRDPRPE